LRPTTVGAPVPVAPAVTGFTDYPGGTPVAPAAPIPFTVVPGPLYRFVFVDTDANGWEIGIGAPPPPPPNPQVRWNTQIPVEIIAVDQFGNNVDTSAAFPGGVTVGDLTNTVYEDPTPGDDQVQLTSQLDAGGYRVARYIGFFVITAALNNDVIIVSDNTPLSTVAGTSNAFNVVPDVVYAYVELDSAPAVATTNSTVEMFRLRITNNDTLERILLNGIEITAESSSSGTNFAVDPSTLIDSITVTDLTNGTPPVTLVPGSPGWPAGVVTPITVATPALPPLETNDGINPVPPPPPLPTDYGADTVVLSVTAHIRPDVSAAQVKNLRLRLSDVNGVFETTLLACVPVDGSGVTIQDPAHYLRSGITQIRTSADLAAYNYPNPFNPRTQTTKIVFANPGGQVTIKIFTITGQLVRDLSNDPSLTPPAQGVSQVTWDGKNGMGQVVRNGVYVAIIKAGGAKMTVKIAVIK
jgi:hypothetical protein